MPNIIAPGINKITSTGQIGTGVIGASAMTGATAGSQVLRRDPTNTNYEWATIQGMNSFVRGKNSSGAVIQAGEEETLFDASSQFSTDIYSIRITAYCITDASGANSHLKLYKGASVIWESAAMPATAILKMYHANYDGATFTSSESSLTATLALQAPTTTQHQDLSAAGNIKLTIKNVSGGAIALNPIKIYCEILGV